MSKVLSNMNSAEENDKYLRSVLPTHGKGTNKGKIDWKNSIGYTIEYEYKWKTGEIYKGNLVISNYKSKGQEIFFKNINKSIRTSHLQKCAFGSIFGITTIDFKFEIGDIINGLEIINREIRQRTMHKKDRKKPCLLNEKWYKYKCLKCGNEDWKAEGNLKNGYGCNACCSQKAVLGINTIWDKARWMVGLGVSEEDAKKYVPNSTKEIEVVCPFCGRKKIKKINYIYIDKSIGCICGDSISYSEKFMYSLLEQLNVKFETQYIPKWLNSKQRYDFYLLDYNTIIETHGKQHYNYSGFNRTLEEEQKNDKIKKELALNNRIENYIVIDCRKSEIVWIKEQILNSDLANIIDLSNIDWLKCEEFARGNLVKEVCDYWHEHREINSEDITTTTICKVFGLGESTVRRYLKRGNRLGWCNYNGKEESDKTRKLNHKRASKPIYCPELNRIFTSIMDVEKELKINHSNISNVLNGRHKTAGGYHWKRVDKNSNYYKNYLISKQG